MPYVYGYLRLGQRARTAEADAASLKSAGCSRIFIEKAQAGVVSRPILDRLLRTASRGETICVVSLSDLGRSLQELDETISRLRRLQIHLRSLADVLDTSAASSEMILSAMGAVARFYTRTHVDLTLLGMQLKADAGGVVGRPRVDLEKVKEARHLISAGLPVSAAAKKTGLATSTLYRYLSLRQSSDRSFVEGRS